MEQAYPLQLYNIPGINRPLLAKASDTEVSSERVKPYVRASVVTSRYMVARSHEDDVTARRAAVGRVQLMCPLIHYVHANVLNVVLAIFCLQSDLYLGVLC